MTYRPPWQKPTVTDKVPPPRLEGPRNGGPANNSKYDPRFCKIVESLSLLGATRYEVARALCVSVDTVDDWRVWHPEFGAAFRLGKEAADDRVEQSLYNRAVGYSFDSEKVFCSKEGEVTRVDIVEHVPPDVAAAFIWLKNRRSKQWREKHEVEHSGSVTNVTENELLAKLTQGTPPPAAA